MRSQPSLQQPRAALNSLQKRPRCTIYSSNNILMQTSKLSIYGCAISSCSSCRWAPFRAAASDGRSGCHRGARRRWPCRLRLARTTRKRKLEHRQARGPMNGRGGLNSTNPNRRHRRSCSGALKRRRLVSIGKLLVAALFSLQLLLAAVTHGSVLTHCVPPTRGALEPATPPTMRSRAAGTFDSTFANKRNFAIIIIVMKPVCL